MSRLPSLLSYMGCADRLAQDADDVLHAGRFQDKAALVRKAALQLAGALLSYNPFGAFLALEPLEASLAEHKALLQVCCDPSALHLSYQLRTCAIMPSSFAAGRRAAGVQPLWCLSRPGPPGSFPGRAQGPATGMLQST